MSYQPNVVSKGDIIEINGALFECKTDFNKLRDNKLKLVYVGEMMTKKYYKGIIRERNDKLYKG